MVVSVRSPLLLTALAALEAGISVLPIRADGSKQPSLPTWKGYQRVRPTTAEVEYWFRDPQLGLALVTGQVSGGLVAIDFDDPATFRGWRGRIAQDRLLFALYEHIASGYEETTPKGGRHLLFRCPEVEQSQKLATCPALPPQRVRTLVETRAEGGLIIVDPSRGNVHKTGRPYLRLHGGVQSIRDVRPDQRDALYASLRTFDEQPKPPPVSPRPRAPSSSLSPSLASAQGARPGDLFNRWATWEEILLPHGWQFVRTQKDGEGIWRRPGKEPPGVSATTNYEGSDLLYVFSSATIFEPERAYTKFQAYAHLNHQGNFSEAARELARRGYTTKERRPFERSSCFERKVLCDTRSRASQRSSGEQFAPIVVD